MNPNPNTLRDMSNSRPHLRVVNATYTVKTISNVVLTSGQVLDQAKNVEMRVTVGLRDESYGYFEIYDIASDGNRFYAEGGLWFDKDRKLVDYDGVGELPDIVSILIRDEMDDLMMDMSYVLGDEVGTEKTMDYKLFEYLCPATGQRLTQHGLAFDHTYKVYWGKLFPEVTGITREELGIRRVKELDLTPEQDAKLKEAQEKTALVRVPVK